MAKTDPVTFATDIVGWYAVHINANDVACTGAVPRWFIATLLLPPSTTEATISQIFDQILNACASIGVTLIGGHSEFTPTVSHPVIVGCMLGEMSKSDVIRTSDAQSGNSVVLTKGIANEGTAILARDTSSRLTSASVDATHYIRCK